MAPSPIPHKAGAGVKTDRRAAVPRARRLRSGALTPGYVPAVEDQASRALVRARAAALQEVKAATARRKAFRLRQDSRYEGRATWGAAPRRGLAEVGCPTPAPQRVCQAYVRAVSEPTERWPRLEAALQTQVPTWRGVPVVAASQGRRAVQFTVAVTRSADLGARSRFDTPRQLLSYLGLIPSEPPSGDRRRHGALTTTGNSPARRALLEGAWAYRSPATVSRPRQLRWEKLPNVSQAISWKAQVRLGKRSRRLSARGKTANPVVVVIARELAACLWASAREGAVAH